MFDNTAELFGIELRLYTLHTFGGFGTEGQMRTEGHYEKATKAKYPLFHCRPGHFVFFV